MNLFQCPKCDHTWRDESQVMACVNCGHDKVEYWYKEEPHYLSVKEIKTILGVVSKNNGTPKTCHNCIFASQIPNSTFVHCYLTDGSMVSLQDPKCDISSWMLFVAESMDDDEARKASDMKISYFPDQKPPVDLSRYSRGRAIVRMARTPGKSQELLSAFEEISDAVQVPPSWIRTDGDSDLMLLLKESIHADRSGALKSNEVSIVGNPIVIRNTKTDKHLIILGDSSGTHVPSGHYARIGHDGIEMGKSRNFVSSILPDMSEVAIPDKKVRHVPFFKDFVNKNALKLRGTKKGR